MNEHTTRKERLVVVVAGILALLALYSGVGLLVVRAVCGQMPTGGAGVLSGVHFFFTRDPANSFGTGPGGCVPAASTVWIVYVVFTVAVLGAATWGFMRWSAYRQSPKYLRRTILGRKEIAKRPEIKREMGAKTAVKRGAQVRMNLAQSRSLRPEDVAWLLGSSEGIDVWVSMEDAVIVIGPPRSGKGFMILTSTIVEAPGAVVTTSSRGDNMEATIGARAKKGPVYLFDPEGVTGRSTTIRWSPVRGCEDGDTAKKRAGVLVAGTGLGTGQNQEWAGKAADVLQCLLHAAAVSGADMTELHLWTKSPSAATHAAQILETQSDLGWAPMLRTVLESETKQRDAQWFGVASSLSALDVPTVRALFDVRPGEAQFSPEQFLAESGTLYLTAELRQSVSTPGGVGVFFSMLLDDIASAAHKMAMRTPGGRLDPPAAFVLDEIANIHPWQGLPQAMAAGSGEGLQVTAVFQSRNQAREGWGDNGEGTIWESATRKLVLGGASDTTDLRGLSDLLGVREESTFSQSFSGTQETNYSEQFRERPVLSLDELRRLPERNVLLVAGRSRPMLVDLLPWTERRWAKQVHASKTWHKTNPASQDRHQPGPTFGKAPAVGALLEHSPPPLPPFEQMPAEVDRPETVEST